MSDPAYVAQWGPGPHQTADALIWRHPGWVCLIRREDGSWAIPGGFVSSGETTLAAAIREAEEETGARLRADWSRASVLRDSPDRDPRAHIVTRAHLFVVPPAERMRLAAADDARELRWWKPVALPETMWADHREIVGSLLVAGGLV